MSYKLFQPGYFFRFAATRRQISLAFRPCVGIINRLASILLLAVSAIGCNAHMQTTELDYDQLIFLDAEALAEAGMGTAYSQLLPELEKYVADPLRIEEVVDNDLPRYAVRANGEVYVIYSPSRGKGIWGRATYVFFKLVNDQLTGTSVRFYAIGGGNDLGGIFLTREQAEATRTSLLRPSDWPYLPESAGPWFGQYH